jgi:hypothetical protein
VPIGIEKAFGRDLLDGGGVKRCVWSNESFQEAWTRTWTAAAYVEGFGDEILDKTRVVVELCGHVFGDKLI